MIFNYSGLLEPFRSRFRKKNHRHVDSGAHLGRQIWEQHGSAHAKFKKGREGKLKAKGIIQ